MPLYDIYDNIRIIGDWKQSGELGTFGSKIGTPKIALKYDCVIFF